MRSLLEHRPKAHVPTPVLRPTGVAAAKLPCKPGTSRHVLDELRADLVDVPLEPTAMRQALDPHTWVPNLRVVDLERVRLTDPAPIEENLDAIRAHVDQAPFVKHEDALAMALASIVAMLDETPKPLDVAYAFGRAKYESYRLAKHAESGGYQWRDIDGIYGLIEAEQFIQHTLYDWAKDMAAVPTSESSEPDPTDIALRVAELLAEAGL